MNTPNITPAACSNVTTGIDVLWEDHDILVCLKPYGYLSEGTQDISQELPAALLAQQHLSVLYPVHRLDRPTAGVMVYAKHVRQPQPSVRSYRTKKEIPGKKNIWRLSAEYHNLVVESYPTISIAIQILQKRMLQHTNAVQPK